MEFLVKSPLNRPDVVEVRYDCECGCKPRARYQRGADEAGHEHCCCGRVHFVGRGASLRLESYLAERRARGEDSDVRYTLHHGKVQSPWGDEVELAYALPDKPRAH